MNILISLKLDICSSAVSLPVLKAGKTIIFCLVVLLPFVIQAQPTLTFGGMTPQSGSTFQYYDSQYGYDTSFPQKGPAGPNQLWDFSRYTTTGTNSLTYDSCGSSQCFTTTSRVGGYHRQYFATGNAISLWYANCDVYRIYLDGDDLFRFPMTFNSKYVDSFQIDGTVNYPQVVGFKMVGTDSVEADAWGTLITPAGTYTNTLRVKRVQIFREATNPPTGYGNYTVITYTWYSQNSPNFLYLISQAYGPSPSSICENTRYAYSGSSLGISGSQKQDVVWSISPNPAVEATELCINMPYASKVGITIFDMAGREQFKIPEATISVGSNKILCDVASFPSGIYLIRVSVDGIFSTKKLVVR